MVDVFTEEGIEDEEEEKSSKGSTDSPISNADSIPLFEDADKRGVRTAAYITITKLDAPKSGYKGQIPLNSTLETIAQLFGNGIYNIAVVNHKHKILRTRENIKIDIPSEVLEGSINTAKANGSSSPQGPSILEVIDKLNASHSQEIERQTKQSELITKQVEANSKNYTELIKTSTESSAQREREFLQSASQSNKEFFASMMQMQSAQFQQMMIMMMAGHNQTIESLKASQAANNPLLFVEVLMKGLQMGKGMDDDSPDWLKAIGMGKEMIGELGSLAKVKMLQTMPQTTPEVKPKKKEDKKPSDNKILNKRELMELVKLKRTLLKRGIDLEAMLSEANKHYSAPTSEEQNEEESDDDIEDENDETGDDKPEPNLEREES